MVRNAIGSPRKTTTVVRNLEAAMAAARDGVAREGRRLGPGGTGECLRTNFALLCNTVLEQDGHLLTDEEHRLLRAFQVLELSSWCRWCTHPGKFPARRENIPNLVTSQDLRFMRPCTKAYDEPHHSSKPTSPGIGWCPATLLITAQLPL